LIFNSEQVSMSAIIDTAFLRGAVLRAAAFGFIAAAITQPSLALAADASNGERLAIRWCAACHVVANDQRGANTDAPPFEEIAKRFSEPGLTTFLLDPHAKMPDMNLTRFEAADIAAYVSTLK
jgi:mono/diheme cytochrome c family protein